KTPPAPVTIRTPAPRHANVGSTPTVSMRRVATGAVTSAPAPNPPTATPVMNPRLSGNHFTRTATGTMYPNPRPMPPMTPYVRYSQDRLLVNPARNTPVP